MTIERKDWYLLGFKQTSRPVEDGELFSAWTSGRLSCGVSLKVECPEK